MVSRIAGIHNQAIMNLSFRWMIVCVFAILAFAGPLAWARNFERQLANQIERQLRVELIAAGKADEAAKLSLGGQLQDLGMELSAAEANRLVAADLLCKFWWLWALIVIACSYGLFALLGHVTQAAPPINREGLR